MGYIEHTPVMIEALLARALVRLVRPRPDLPPL